MGLYGFHQWLSGQPFVLKDVRKEGRKDGRKEGRKERYEPVNGQPRRLPAMPALTAWMTRRTCNKTHIPVARGWVALHVVTLHIYHEVGGGGGRGGGRC